MSRPKYRAAGAGRVRTCVHASSVSRLGVHSPGISPAISIPAYSERCGNMSNAAVMQTRDEGGLNSQTGQKRSRTKSGCQNCRRKRKKCKPNLATVVLCSAPPLLRTHGPRLTVQGDEQRPQCTKCLRANETCEYGPVFRFRPTGGLDGISMAPPTKRRNTGPRLESREVPGKTRTDGIS
jgi:hypothetical protein